MPGKAAMAFPGEGGEKAQIGTFAALLVFSLAKATVATRASGC